MGKVIQLKSYDARHAGSVVPTPLEGIKHSTAESFLCSFSALTGQLLPVLSPLLPATMRSNHQLVSVLTDPAIALKLISAGWARAGRPPSLAHKGPAYFYQSLGDAYLTNLLSDSPRIDGGTSEAILRDVWGSYLQVGYLAARLVQLTDQKPETSKAAFFLGLCHDAGWLVQLMNSPRNPSRLVAQISLESNTTSGTTHERLAQTLAYSWGLPRLYADVISFHHQADIEAWWKPNEAASIFYTVCVSVILTQGGVAKLLGQLNQIQHDWVVRRISTIQRICDEAQHIRNLASDRPELAVKFVNDRLSLVESG